MYNFVFLIIKINFTNETKLFIDKRKMRIGFLWSLLNLSGVGIKQHIVIQTPPTIQDNRLFLEQVFSGGADPCYENRKLIRFSNDFDQEKGMTTVPLRTVYDARDDIFPQHHIFSRSHFLRFTHSIYASVMEYAEFCKMEDKLAHIVANYLADKKNNWLIMMDDPFLMGSIRGYGSRSSMVDQSTWVTLGKTEFNDVLLMDLETDSSHV